jgi:hypothetical protein
LVRLLLPLHEDADALVRPEPEAAAEAATVQQPGIEVIEKPFELDVLVRRVRAALESGRQTAATRDRGAWWRCFADVTRSGWLKRSMSFVADPTPLHNLGPETTGLVLALHAQAVVEQAISWRR